MSRGRAALQGTLYNGLHKAGRPVTFEELIVELLGRPLSPGEWLRPTRLRSWRRSLRKLVDGGLVLAVGEGGPRQPLRYCVHPVLLLGEDNAAYNALCALLCEGGYAKDLNEAMTAELLHAPELLEAMMAAKKEGSAPYLPPPPTIHPL